MINIDIKSSRFEFNMTVNQKITVIRGNSGKGKSTFAKAAEDVSGAYKVSVSDSKYRLEVPSNKDWYRTISRNIEHKDKCIYVIDDADYVTTKEFASLFKEDKYSFYILINRFAGLSIRSMSQLPFDIDEVYEFKADGKKHWLSKDRA